MVARRELGDLAAELVGIEGTVATLSLMVKPKETIGENSTITESTLEGVFFHILTALDRIADDLDALERESLKASAQ